MNHINHMVDLHTHILPGLDDGAKNWEESLKMCTFAQKEGITTIVCTPHIIPGTYDNNREKILLITGKLKEKLKQQRINLKVVPGAEIRLFPDIIKQLKNKTLLTINDMGKFLLIEFPLNWIPPFTRDLIFQLQLRNFTPIISHPERNRDIRETPDLVYHLVKQGALIQISSLSILGYLGKRVRRFCEKLIRHNLVHLVASDIHSPGKFFLRESLKTISGWIGKESALKLFTENPQRIVRGEDLKIC
ncbi:hypothetical protein HQ584_06560 [Patescibacteria group bacterium]|nr:hypothetical protein [Patescibacteria group bacterium]